MLIPIAEAVVGVAFLLLAVFDVFWPLTVAFCLGVAVAWWFGRLGALAMFARPDLIAGYIVAGFAWVFFKWTRLVEGEIRKALTYRHRNPSPPKWNEHAYDFAAYFFYWPLDMLAYVLSDLLQEAWSYIARMVARSFDRYAEWRFESALSVDAVDPHVGSEGKPTTRV